VSQWENPDHPQLAESGRPRSAHRPALIAVGGVLVLGAAIGGLAISGAFEGDGADGPDPAATSVAGSTPGTTPSPEPTPEETEIPGVTVGTPENPYEPGDSVTILDDWTMTIGEVDTDTWPDLEPHFLETDPDDMDFYRPAPGMVYVSAPSSMVYTGEPKDQDRLKSVFVGHVAADGESIATNSCGSYGLAVEPFWPLNMPNEPRSEGVACVEIPPARVEGGQWRISFDWIEPDGQYRTVYVYYKAS
jgi:hypothetical protein